MKRTVLLIVGVIAVLASTATLQGFGNDGDGYVPQCYTDHCKGKTNLRACYNCCAKHCPYGNDTLKCQTACQSILRQFYDIDGINDHTDIPDLLNNDAFWAVPIQQPEVQLLEHLSMTLEDEANLRWVLVTASDRLMFAEPNRQQQVALHWVLLDGLRHPDPRVRICAIACIEENELQMHPWFFPELIKIYTHDTDRTTKERVLHALTRAEK